MNPTPTQEPASIACDESLRSELIRFRDQPDSDWSNNRIARKISRTGAVISQYLNEKGNKYTGDVEELERRIRDFLRNESRRRLSGVETSDCEIAREIRAGLEYIRKTNDVGEILAEPGQGKTRAIDLYCRDNPIAFSIQARAWSRDNNSISAAVFDHVKSGWDGNTKRAIHAINKLRGSDILIIVDDAHKLTRPALMWLFDLHDETGCPIALIGTYELEDKLEDDPQRFSRVGLRWEIKPKNPRELIKHLINSLVPDKAGLNGDFEILRDLCELVAAQHGHYRSVHKQLKLAVELKEAKPKLDWPTAFRQAHTLLLRNYKLA